VEGDIQEREYQPHQFVESSNIPSAKLEQKELRDALFRGLNRLNDSYRTVLVLRDIQHLSSTETAGILNISQELVDIRLHRARLQMRKHVSSFFRRPTREWIPFSLRMMKIMGKTMLRRVISCRRVMKELSNYIDECVSEQLRKAIEEHLEQCDRCSTVLDTTRKVLYIVGDDKVFDLPFKCNQNWDRLLNKTAGGGQRASSA
jgi:RNA polymerase sigma-70 factor (ECF subfamily)